MLLLLLVLFVKKKEEKNPCHVLGLQLRNILVKKKNNQKNHKTLENLQMSPYRTLCFQNTKPVLKSVVPSSHLLVHLT